MNFNDINIDSLLNMDFNDFVDMDYIDCINVKDNKVTLNNSLFDFMPAIPYDDFMRMEFDDFSKIFDDNTNNNITKNNDTNNANNTQNITNNANMAQLMQAQQMSQAEMVKHMTRPKQVIRDEQGRAQGII